MSSKAQKELDKALFKYLKKTAGKFREFYSDKKVHIIHLNLMDTIHQTWEEMARREGYKTIKEFKLAMGKEAQKDLTNTAKKGSAHLISMLYRNLGRAAKSEAKTWSITFGKRSNNKKFTVTIGSVGGKANVFKKFKSFKAPAQKFLIKGINKWNKKHSNRGVDRERPEESNQIRRKEKVGDKMTGSNDPFIDVGHMEGSEIGTLRALAAKDFLANWVCTDSACEAAKKDALQTLKDTCQMIFKDKKDFKGEMEKDVEATLESSRINKASMSKGEVVGLNNALFKAMGRVQTADGWVHGKGSDSFFDMVEKTAVASIVSKISKNKNVKIYGKKVKWKKRKNSNTTTKGKKRSVGAKRAKGPAYRKVPITRLKKPANKDGGDSGAFAPLQMIGLINKELPDAVENNMGRPRLESVTGRFARSTTVTDILTTPQGFPSIGYTYQLSPYQTFEGDDDYDPRTLIDQSIRAVAVKFAMGRFYTRRVG
jgi:hypothetical protein